MRGARQRDDGWDEGRRDSWQNGNGYQQDSAAGYPNGTSYAGQHDYAFQAGYGDQASGAAGQGHGGQGYETRSYDPNGYPDSGYPGSGQSAVGYGGAGYDSTGYSDGTGYPGGYGQSGYAATGASGQYGWASSSPGSEFLPADESASGNDNAPGTPRPYGRLSIFTLLDDKAAEFDRLAERAAEGVRTAEPDTLVYVIHVVPKAPMQRIIYEIYRDRAAFESHEQQPHIQRFAADRRSCVLATNIIDLRLKYAKVTALAAAQAPGAPTASASPGFGQQTQLDHVPAGLGSGDRYAANGYSAGNGQYQSNDRYAAASAAGYSATPTSQYQANGQYAAPAAPQYTATSQYAAGNGQYGSGQYGSGRYPEPGSGRQPDGGGRHAETTGGYGQASGYGRTGGYTQGGGQYREPDQDTGTDARQPTFEPAERDRTASRAGRY